MGYTTPPGENNEFLIYQNKKIKKRKNNVFLQRIKASTIFGKEIKPLLLFTYL